MVLAVPHRSGIPIVIAAIRPSTCGPARLTRSPKLCQAAGGQSAWRWRGIAAECGGLCKETHRCLTLLLSSLIRSRSSRIG
jgi:hypothetical protein